MDEPVSLYEFLEKTLKNLLSRNQKLRVAVIGPSTLDRDPSTLYLSDILSGTEAELLVVDLPDGKSLESYGSLKLLKRQMEFVREKHKHLKQPAYIEESVFSLVGKIERESLDVIYDHDSLGWILIERPQGTDRETAKRMVIHTYRTLLKPNGILILAESGWDPQNEQHMNSWEMDIAPVLEANSLHYKKHAIHDIQIKRRFPLIQNLSEYGNTLIGLSTQYPCQTMLVCSRT